VSIDTVHEVHVLLGSPLISLPLQHRGYKVVETENTGKATGIGRQNVYIIIFSGKCA